MPSILTGTVVSDKQDKTAVVSVSSSKRHPLYRKNYTSHKKYHVHDEKNQAKEGYKVTFEECAPISKNKNWKLKEIIDKGPEGKKG